jgi:excisionase family DNA binding protein
MDERWLSVDDVTEYLGIKRFTVYKWVKRLGLPAHKIGRLLKFRKSEIDEWVKSHDRKMPQVITSEQSLQLLKQFAPEIKKFGVRRIGLFGSWVRGEANAESDIDIVVEFTNPNFDDYMDLKFFLERLFGREVDLVLKDSLKPRIKPKIMREVLYAEGF